jgi:hypothetical protein
VDTDHITVLRYEEDSRHWTLVSRLKAAADKHLVTTTVTVEEQMRGWLAEINRWREVRRQSGREHALWPTPSSLIYR